jgi:pimeloyl-ACP methyl ester carboxylesterase
MIGDIATEELLRVRSPDGARLAVWRSGEGPALVLVHGTTVSHGDWLPVLPALRRQFTVYAMDRRGIGASGDAEAYALEREFEDVAAVADSVGEPVFLVGHSFGALCSLEAALLTPNIRKLVLYEPPIPIADGNEFHPDNLLGRLEACLAAGRPDEVLATFLREVAGQEPERIELQRRARSWPDRVATAHTIVREVRGTHFYRLRPERLRAMAVPTLMLLGGESPRKHQAASPAVAAALPNARLEVLPGQMHIAIHLAPRQFLDAVLPFLA